MTTTNKIDWSKPVLKRQSANCEEPEAIRNATPEEIEASRAAGFEGYFEVQGEGVCFVEE